MANELNIQLDRFNDSGLTLLAKVFSLDGTQQGSSVSMSEVGGIAYYTGDFSLSGLSDGSYSVSFETSTEQYGTGSLYVRDGSEVTHDQLLKYSEYTEPDNAGIASNGWAISALNNISSADVYTYFTDANRGDAFKADLSTLNDFDPASDTVARVTLVDTTTANTDMRGTDGANTVAPDNAGITAVSSAISNLNDISAAEVKAQADQALTDYDGPTLAQMTAAFNEIKGAGFTNETLKYIADRIDAGGGSSASDIYAYFTDSSREDAFKADLSTLNDLSASQVRAEIERNGGMLDSLPTLSEMVQSSLAKESNVTGAIQTITSEISSLNDISAAEVKTEADQALADYDAPTKAELDSAETTIISAVNNINPLQASTIYTYFTDANREDAFKASGYATSADLTSSTSAIRSDISGLNDISSADVTAAVPSVQEITEDIERTGGMLDNLPTLDDQKTALTEKTDLTSTENNLENSINNIPDAVLDKDV